MLRGIPRMMAAAVYVVPPRRVRLPGVLVHQAIGAPMVVSGNLFVLVSGSLCALVVLVVFGIWGFRLGSRGSGDNPGGGGPKRPEPMTPSPGGRELDDERLLSDLDVGSLFELPDPKEQVQENRRDLVAPGPHR
jgi:hypothetical protein